MRNGSGGCRRSSRQTAHGLSLRRCVQAYSLRCPSFQRMTSRSSPSFCSATGRSADSGMALPHDSAGTGDYREMRWEKRMVAPELGTPVLKLRFSEHRRCANVKAQGNALIVIHKSRHILVLTRRMPRQVTSVTIQVRRIGKPAGPGNLVQRENMPATPSDNPVIHQGFRLVCNDEGVALGFNICAPLVLKHVQLQKAQARASDRLANADRLYSRQ